MAYSPDGRTLASASSDRTVKLWETATGKEIRTLRGARGRGHGVAYSPDGRTLASASGGQPSRLWEAATGREIRTPPRRIAQARRHEVQAGWCCDVQSRRPHPRLRRGLGNVKLWDAASGGGRSAPSAVSLERIRGRACAYSPDGRTLASAGH